MPEVLIAEDNPDLRTIFVKIFEHAGYTVRLATDGIVAQQCLIHALPDVLLLDVNMPGLTGLEIVQFVRQIQGDKHVNIIMVTADHLAQQTKAADQADLFLLKPVNPVELVTFTSRLMQSGHTSH